jgi:hypothetical protein
MTQQNIVIGGRRIGRFRAGIILFKETFRFLRSDAEMLFVPIVALCIELFLFGALALLLVGLGFFTALQSPDAELSLTGYVGVFIGYVISAFVIAWSQAAIAHIVYVRAHGGNATLGEGLRVATAHWSALLVWSCITSTVGLVLRAIAERSGTLARIVTALMGAAWSILTYFVVPSIVIGKRSAFAAISDSGSVFKRTWGETLVTNISFSGLVALIIMGYMVVLIGILFVSGWSAPLFFLLMVLFILGVMVLLLVSTALSSILRTLLYVYASEGTVPTNFNSELLKQMLARKTPHMPSTPIPGTGTSVV